MSLEKFKTYHRVLLNEWILAITNGEFEKAIQIDITHYNELVKKNEDVSFWNKWQEDTIKIRNELTHYFEKIIPYNDRDDVKSEITAIVHHNFSGLAHETQLARNLIYLNNNNEKIEFDVIYLFGDSNDKLNPKKIYGIDHNKIHYLNASSYIDAALKLNELCRRIKYKSILYPSIFWLAYWISLFLPHSNQKFLQMKYYPLQSGRIKIWGGGQRNSEKFYRINGNSFLQLPILDLKIDNLITTEFETRSGDEIYFGSISRTEKIINNNYNIFIKKILDNNSDLIYLYTGKLNKNSTMPSYISNHNRAIALGWVDPLKAIKIFNIYLEPFPWGGGDMTLLALQYGIPYLTLETEENKKFGIYDFIKFLKINNHEILEFSFCKTMNDLASKIILLKNDKELRNKLGKSWRDVIYNYKPQNVERWVEFIKK